MRARFLLTAFFLLLLAPAMLYAEIREGSFEVNPFVGYYNLHETEKGGLGIRAGYNITKNLGVEGAFDHVKSHADLYHADVLYHFMPESSLNPFVFAGAGVAKRKGDIDSYTKPLGEIGVGLKYFFTDNIGLRVDVRDVQEKYNNVIATAGLVFRFGGKSQKVAVTPKAVAPEPKPEPIPEPKPETKPEPKPEPKAEPKVEKPEPPMVAAVAEKKAEAKKIEKERIELKILFDTNKADIKNQYVSEIKRVAEYLKRNTDVTVEIQGHTDNVGSDKYNLKLSQRRADNVRNYLIKKFGIDPAKLTAKGYGKSQPIEDNKTKEGKQKNRRTIAVFYVDKE